MENREKFLAGATDDLREILSKIFDRALAANKSGRAMFSPFLSEAEYAQFLQRKKHIDFTEVTAFGGYDEANRVVLRFGDDNEGFPISVIKITGRGLDKLRHGDFLGSIMSLGIERGKIGDIIRNGEECIVLSDEVIAPYIADSLRSVGGVYVNCTIENMCDVKIEAKFETITGTVASLRADSVVSVMLKTSRSKAADYIEAQQFYLNQVLCTKCDKEIKENDILTVRHYGKAKLKSVSGLSKKGRIFITIQKYM